MFTTKALQVALSAAVLTAAASTADAKPRRVVVLDLNGPRALADSSRSAIISLLGKQYDIVGTQKWLDAKAAVSRRTHGPEAWTKTAKQTGVDAVIDGYINEEGRAKVLTVIVTDAATGQEMDALTIRLPAKGFNEAAERKLSEGLEERFDFIEPLPQSAGRQYDEYEPKKPKVKDRTRIGAKQPVDETEEVEGEEEEVKPKRRRTKRVEREETEEEVTEKPARVATVTQTKKEKEDENVAVVFGLEKTEIEVLDPKRRVVSRPTPVAQFSGGFGYGSRSLAIGAEDPGAVDNLLGVPNKSLQLSGAFYPFPRQKRDGVLSGVGFSFQIDKSLGGSVAVLGEEETVEFNINQYSFHGGIHYRVALNESFAFDGEVGYGQHHYQLLDPPDFYEVPDVGYGFLTAGGSLDLSITDRSSVGFGAKYLYMLETGNLNDTGDFVGYGPGTSWGVKLDGHFVIPLPKNMFVRGDISYTRIKSTFDGQGSVIAEEAMVYEASDSVVQGAAKIGIEF
jgi:hypothetical protein